MEDAVDQVQEELTLDPEPVRELIEVQGDNTVENSGTWEGRLALVGVVTGDGRRIEPGGLTHRPLPLPLMAQFQNPETGGHALAVIAGNISEIWVEGDSVFGRGSWDSGEDGQRARQLARDGMMTGISVDLDAVDGIELIEEGDMVYRNFLKARIMGATLTPFPAFSDAHMTLVADGALVDESAIFDLEDDMLRIVSSFSTITEVELETAPEGFSEALTTASMEIARSEQFSLQSIPVEPPSWWFDDPKLDRVQPVSVDKNGRVYGHVAAWGSCHISYQKCRDVPRCGTYKKFMNKTILCDDGTIRPCGNVFIDTEHADGRAAASVAADHYANTGTAVADVAIYEDKFGLVIAGAVRPSATPEQVRIFRGSDISPDWRKFREKGRSPKWELVGLLSVNTSGFVVDSLLASGEFTFAQVQGAKAYMERVEDELDFVSLVAAGMVPRESIDVRLNAALDRIDALEEELASVKEFTDSIREYAAEIDEFVSATRNARLQKEFESLASRF